MNLRKLFNLVLFLSPGINLETAKRDESRDESQVTHSVIIHSLIHQLNRYKLIECFLSAEYWRCRVIILKLCHQETCKNFEMGGKKKMVNRVLNDERCLSRRREA